MEGSTLAGKYVLDRRIASGGMSHVYLGRQQPLGRPVAVKVLRSDDVFGDEATLSDKGIDLGARLRREAETLAAINHPNVVTIIDYGVTDQGMIYLVMEYVDGQTMCASMRDSGPFDGARALRVGIQVSAALHEIHRHGVVHRDLKPGNILLRNQGDETDFVKVVDFGIVKYTDSDLETTDRRLRLGSPRYMAPEQILGNEVGPATDIYALGCVLYYMVSGRPPFIEGDTVQLMYAHVTKPPEPLEEAVASTLSPEFRALIERCLLKNPPDRFASMQAVCRALMSTPEYQGTTDPTLSRLLSTSMRPPPPSGALPIEVPRRALLRGGIAVAGAALLVAVGMIATTMLSAAARPAPLVSDRAEMVPEGAERADPALSSIGRLAAPPAGVEPAAEHPTAAQNRAAREQAAQARSASRASGRSVGSSRGARLRFRDHHRRHLVRVHVASGGSVSRGGVSRGGAQRRGRPARAAGLTNAGKTTHASLRRRRLREGSRSRRSSARDAGRRHRGVQSPHPQGHQPVQAHAVRAETVASGGSPEVSEVRDASSRPTHDAHTHGKVAPSAEPRPHEPDFIDPFAE